MAYSRLKPAAYPRQPKCSIMHVRYEGWHTKGPPLRYNQYDIDGIGSSPSVSLHVDRIAMDHTFLPSGWTFVVY